MAVWLVSISLLADGGLREVLVENIKSIHVTRSELRAIDMLKKTSSLVGGSNICRAYVRNTIARLNSMVNPAVFFNNS